MLLWWARKPTLAWFRTLIELQSFSKNMQAHLINSKLFSAGDFRFSQSRNAVGHHES